MAPKLAMREFKQTIRRGLHRARSLLGGGTATALGPDVAQSARRGDYAGAMALVQARIDALGNGADRTEGRKLRHALAHFATLDGQYPVAARIYIALLDEDEHDAAARRGIAVAAHRAARAAQANENWREACDMWLALAKFGGDRTKALRNLALWGRNGSLEAEARRDYDAAVGYWRDCLEIEPTYEPARKNIARILADPEIDEASPEVQARMHDHWRALLRHFPADVRAKLGVLRSGGTIEGNTPVDAMLRRIDAAPAAKTDFFFDVSDIAVFFRGNRTPTGIQRIAFCLIKSALADESRASGLCALDRVAGGWRRVNGELFRLLLFLSRDGSDTGEIEWKSAREELEDHIRHAPRLVFPVGAVVVNLGSPWSVINYLLRIREAKRESRIFYAGFVHDTIPLLFPKFTFGETPAAYTTWIAGIASHADLMFANTKNTERDFEGALGAMGLTPVPCEVVYPNGDFTSHAEGPIAETVQAAMKGPYALFVGTIEPRKNHLFVLEAWQRLVAELGAANVPTLVCAGRLGWYGETVMAFVEKTNHLGGKLVMLNSVSDADLRALYRGARFTVYNSVYEGWGLPVTESFSYGKVPVIPRNSGLVESGGEHAVFYESNSQPSFLAAVRELIAHPETLAQKEQRIRTAPPIRPWRDILDELRGKAVRAAAAAPAKDAPRAVVHVGELYPFRLHAFVEDPGHGAVAEIMRTGTGWHAIDKWGAWTAEPTAELDFDLAEPPQPDLVLLLVLRAAKPDQRVTIALNGKPAGTFPVSPAGSTVRIPLGTTPAGGHVRVEIGRDQLTHLTEITSGRDHRMAGVCLRALMVCRAADANSCAALTDEHASDPSTTGPAH